MSRRLEEVCVVSVSTLGRCWLKCEGSSGWFNSAVVCQLEEVCTCMFLWRLGGCKEAALKDETASSQSSKICTFPQRQARPNSRIE